jgi:hypothetical protein
VKALMQQFPCAPAWGQAGSHGEAIVRHGSTMAGAVEVLDQLAGPVDYQAGP